MSQKGDFNDNENESNDPTQGASPPGSFTPGSFSQGIPSQEGTPPTGFTQGGPFSQGIPSQISQSNPFSADLKGDFTSNFGTSTNAVSHIFKDGGFVGENRNRILLIASLVLFMLVGGFLLFSNPEDDYEDEELIAEEELIGDADKKAEGEAVPVEEIAEEVEEVVETPPTPIQEAEPAIVHQLPAGMAMPAGTEAPVIGTPTNGATRHYDETSTDAEFTWSGSPGGWILFSRSETMNPVDFRSRVQGNSFTYRKAYPGTWYWQVKNGAGASQVQSFTIETPARRQVVLTSPTEAGSLAGNGGSVVWSGDHKVAYYRVEISNSGWANPMYRFATSGTQLQIQSVPAGPYQLRLGAFSEVAGRWEYSEPINVTVQ